MNLPHVFTRNETRQTSVARSRPMCSLLLHPHTPALGDGEVADRGEGIGVGVVEDPPGVGTNVLVALRVAILRNYWRLVAIKVFFCLTSEPEKEAPWAVPIFFFCVRENVRRRLERQEERLSP